VTGSSRGAARTCASTLDVLTAQHAALRGVRAFIGHDDEHRPVLHCERGHRGWRYRKQRKWTVRSTRFNVQHELLRLLLHLAVVATSIEPRLPVDCVRKAGSSWQTARRLATLSTHVADSLKRCCRHGGGNWNNGAMHSSFVCNQRHL
jgi:hypothetical protein